MDKEHYLTHWQKVRLGDAPIEIIDGDRGKNYPAQSDFFEDEYCLFLNTKNVRPTRFDFSTCQFITAEHDKLLRKGKLKRNDIVLTTRGTIGNIAFYDNNIPFENIRINSGMVVIRPDETKLFPKFTYYLFRKLQNDFSVFTTGSAQPQLPIKDLIKLSAIIPPLPTQRAIAATLSCLDDKIELNNRINANLEAQAQAIFKSWFVDFEPFKGGEFIDSELGRIPKGWSVGLFSDFVNIKYGKAHQSLNDGEIPVYGSGGLMRYAEKPLYDKESVLIPRKGTLNNIMYITEPFWTVDTMFYTEMKKTNIANYIYQFIKRKDLNSMNTGTAVPSMTIEILNSLNIVTPPDNVLKDFSDTVSTLYRKQKVNHKESRTLAAIRDTLLPRLMSGEIDIKEQ
jgi:type I restriction enzyme S subunit